MKAKLVVSAVYDTDGWEQFQLGTGDDTAGLSSSKKCWRFEELSPDKTRVFSSLVFRNYAI